MLGIGGNAISVVISILVALLVFGVLIFVHELGHFTAARCFGVCIREFSIGMGPKLIEPHLEEERHVIFSASASDRRLCVDEG